MLFIPAINYKINYVCNTLPYTYNGAIVNSHSRMCTKLESKNLDLSVGSVTNVNQGGAAESHEL